MTKQKSFKISPATRYQNAALNYYLALTKSSYLHYGYWEPLPTEDELTLGRFRKAQKAYATKLLSFIPENIHTVLDVGCGVGGNALELLERGFEVEGLAPDPFQEKQFLQTTQSRAKFHLTTFEDFQSTSVYDLILLSESSQYMAATDIAQGAGKLLKSGGYLLLADMMRSDPSYTQGIFSNCHLVEELHEALVQAGFHLVKSEDISTQIAPTIDLCLEDLRTYGLSTFNYIGEVISIAVPPIHSLLSKAFNHWAKKPLTEGLAARNIFDKHLCYKIQLWQRSS